MFMVTLSPTGLHELFLVLRIASVLNCTVPASASNWRQETGEPASWQPGPCGPVEQATPFSGRVNQGSLFFFSIVFVSVLVCLTLSQICFVRTILSSNWLAEPCPKDAYVEELISANTSSFRICSLLNKTVHVNCFAFLKLYFSFFSVFQLFILVMIILSQLS